MRDRDRERVGRRRALGRLLASAALLASCPLLNAVFARLGPRLFPGYRLASKALMGLLAQAFSVAPFALWDLMALVMLLGTLVGLSRRLRARKPLLPVLSRVALVVSIAAALFANGWALNHYAPPLSGEMGFEVRQYSVSELAEATRAYLEQAARLAPQVPRKADGTLAEQDFYELARVAGASYGALEGRYPVLEGPRVPVKALLVWGPPLLYSGHTGIFWAPTGESCVPLDVARADEAFIMCHEAAHRLGIASEQEANFAAYVACEASDDVRLRYSGAYNAFVYCYNALYRYDRELAQQALEEAATGELHDGLTLLVADHRQASEHYDAYEGGFQKVGTTVNDTYLKSYGETEGIRSYGLVVDYLIAWHSRG